MRASIRDVHVLDSRDQSRRVGHPTPRKAKHDDVVAPGVFAQALSQQLTGLSPIAKVSFGRRRHGHLRFCPRLIPPTELTLGRPAVDATGAAKTGPTGYQASPIQ